MISSETEAFLSTGCALIVGTTTADGAPFATRGWGVTVLDASSARLRVVLFAEDQWLLQGRAPRLPMAITCGDVRTLRSIQLKGHLEKVEAADEADLERATQYCDAFFSAVESIDGTSRRLVERLRPIAFSACEIQVDEIFDQTPGPGAGAAIAGQA